MGDNFTAKELEDILHEMGQHVETQAELHRLKTEIDQYFHEEPSFSDENDDANVSLFASLSIDPAAQFLKRRAFDEEPEENIHSPIVSRRRRGKFNEFENIDYPEEESTSEDPETQMLISQAYAKIGHIYNSCRSVARVMKDYSSSSVADEEDEETLRDEEEDIGESVSVPVSVRTGSESKQAPPLIKNIIVDPSVRPVRSPKPGRAPYKFDPVTRYHLYKEEWDRHPAPGDLRRLSLRWKVREFMLRHDIPRLNGTGPAQHEKDWSPRPYLD